MVEKESRVLQEKEKGVEKDGFKRKELQDEFIQKLRILCDQALDGSDSAKDELEIYILGRDTTAERIEKFAIDILNTHREKPEFIDVAAEVVRVMTRLDSLQSEARSMKGSHISDEWWEALYHGDKDYFEKYYNSNGKAHGGRW